MKTIKESILSSTGAGMSGMIIDLLENYYINGLSKPLKRGEDFEVNGNEIHFKCSTIKLTKSSLPNIKEMQKLQGYVFVCEGNSSFVELELYGLKINKDMLKKVNSSGLYLNLYNCKIDKSSYIPKCDLTVKGCIVDFDKIKNMEGIYIDKKTFFLSNWEKLKNIKVIFDTDSHFGSGNQDNIDRTNYEFIYSALK